MVTDPTPLGKTQGRLCIPYAQLEQICGGTSPTLPHYERHVGLVYAYLPVAITVVQLGEVVAQIRHLWPGLAYQLVFVTGESPEGEPGT